MTATIWFYCKHISLMIVVVAREKEAVAPLLPFAATVLQHGQQDWEC